MQDIQSLLEKINREGVEKADAEAKRIISDAKTSAEAIVREAKLQAEKFKAEAEKSAADYSSRAEESIRQAARDVVLETKEAINTLLERLLIKDVNTALNDEKTVCELVESAIKELSCKGEITCGAKLAETLKAQSANLGEFSLVLDESADEGFSVRIDGGRIEHAFTAEVIAAEISKRLRADLAKLIG